MWAIISLLTFCREFHDVQEPPTQESTLSPPRTPPSRVVQLGDYFSPRSAQRQQQRRAVLALQASPSERRRRTPSPYIPPPNDDEASPPERRRRTPSPSVPPPNEDEQNLHPLLADDVNEVAEDEELYQQPVRQQRQYQHTGSFKAQFNTARSPAAAFGNVKYLLGNLEKRYVVLFDS
jgi:hypothetical protein